MLLHYAAAGAFRDYVRQEAPREELSFAAPVMSETDSTDATRFAVLSDIHYRGPEDDQHLDALLREVIELDPPPARLLVLGDLVEEASPAALKRVRGALERAGMEFHVVPGNHDHTREGDGSAFDEVFPGCRNYRFDWREIVFIGLDSTRGAAWNGVAIPDASLAFLDETLSGLPAERQIVLFTHFPLGENVPMRPTNACALLQRLEGRCVRAIFNGHYHGRTVRRFGLGAITTSPCCSPSVSNHDGSTQKGYRLASIAAGETGCEFVSARSLPPGEPYLLRV